MVARCLVLLAVVAQISGSGCNCGVNSVVVPVVGSSALPAPTVFVSAENSGFGDSPAVTRNLIGQGKYPVAMGNCGGTTDNHIPITTSHVTAAPQEKPTIHLPTSIPAPRVISHSCTCYKTILRPRVHQQIITVPSVQRFVATSHKPVLESIQYEAVPVNSGSSGVQLFQTGSGVSSCGPLGLVSPGCVSPVQTVQIPSVQFPQTIQVPQIQTAQIQPQPSFACCSCQC